MSVQVPLLRRLKSSQGNPGDIFIAQGLEYLFESIEDIDWLYLDKFSYKDFLKEVSKSKTKNILFGGTPQYNNYDYWCFWYDDILWDYAKEHDFKIASVAGGSGYPDPRMSPDSFTKDCLSSKRTRELLGLRKEAGSLFTVRDPHSHALLNSVGITNHMLPCTAYWTFKKHEPTSDLPDNYWVLTPSNWNAIPDKYFKDCNNKAQEALFYYRKIYDEMKARLGKVIICFHSEKEYKYYSKCFQESELFYSNDWLSLLSFYSKAKGILTGRLHGAVPFLGLPGRKAHLIAVDTRYSATEFFGSITKSVYSDPVGYIVDQFVSGEPTNPNDLISFENKYKELFSNYLELLRV